MVKKLRENPPLDQGGKGRLAIDFRASNRATRRKAAVMSAFLGDAPAGRAGPIAYSYGRVQRLLALAHGKDSARVDGHQHGAQIGPGTGVSIGTCGGRELQDLCDIMML